MHHTLVCLALNHYIHTLPVGADKSVAVSNRSKVYQHRGAAIKSLSHYVGKDKTMCSDMSIASIMMFMSMEVSTTNTQTICIVNSTKRLQLQNPAMADWRSHASGMKQLVDMRGGFKSLLQQSPYLAPTLVIYILYTSPLTPTYTNLSLTPAPSILNMANTCSPSWDQLSLSGTPAQNISDITSVYDQIFPYTLCPPSLFLSILRTNHLRQRASALLFAGDFDPTHTLEAHDLLTAIESFSPDDWAQPGEYAADWRTIGTIYQSAIALYCTMALQSLTILPNSLEMNAMRSVHGDRLLDGLRSALENERLRGFMIWPLTVAGVEAGYRDGATRCWIGDKFAKLSRDLGTSSPLKALAVLRRYWGREEPGWDECFEKPYVFVI